MEKPTLHRVQKGYAEVYYDTPENDWGVVHTKLFVNYTDFEKDAIYEVERWIPMVYTGTKHGLNGLETIGRLTGYRTRKEALDALTQYVSDLVDFRKEE